MSFPRYPAYKPSGMDWLGEVPEHWEVLPLKRRSRLLTEKTECRDNPIALENIEGWTGRLVETDSEFLGEGVVFEPGDILFGKLRPYLAKVYLAAKGGQAVGDFHVIHPFDSLHPRFLQFLLLTKEMIDLVNGSTFGAKMPRASWDFLASLHLSIPPLDEQSVIATFLGHETAKIDALIAEQQRLIELLQEKRQAVISHAVTKGLNPHAPMKDSGVEWLGEVPEHWEVRPVKRFLVSMNYRRIPLSSEERASRKGEYPYYGASGIIDSVDEYIFDESLVLVSEDGANLLMRSTPIAFVASGKYWVNNHAHILKPLDDMPLFWSERIESLQIAPFVTGSAQPKLTAEALLNLVVACPVEQREKEAIEKLIQQAKAESDSLLEESRQAIELLRERRSALISAAVTGQIDVRGLVSEAEAA